MARLIIYLTDDEWEALTGLAQKEYRNPQVQASLIIHKELRRKRLLKNDTESISTEQEVKNKKTKPPEK